MNDLSNDIARRLGLPPKGVEAALRLLDDGATVPFISRYRKEQTGSLDEVAVRAIETQAKALRELGERRDFIGNALREAGVLTPAIEERLREADSMTALEDIYAPYKPKKRTRATMAREKGLEPLAKMIMAGREDDPAAKASRFARAAGISDEEAIAGASDIIAEWASESTRLRNITRNVYRREASIVASPAKGKEEELSRTPFAQYSGFSQQVRRMTSHQYLALRRAEREGLLKVRYSVPDGGDGLDESLCRTFVPRHSGRRAAGIISEAVRDASRRLLRPSVENEISASLKEEADRVAIEIFAGNLRQLLLAPPLKGRRVLALDPGFRTGCKVVALDAQGNLLDDCVIYPVPPKADVKGSSGRLHDLIRRHRLEVVALGNGTASRETERFLRDERVVDPSRLFVVSESGASVYSASDIARQEFPDKDVTVRGAVSIGRRLIDPLAELVKIDPKSIGVGQYQHDVDQTRLREALDFTVESCVNAVGVDVNTASGKLLSYVSGIGPALAANIVAYRAANGDFSSRSELKKVPRLGDKAFQMAAGFLRVPGGRIPLDNTGIHPESYHVVREMAESIGVDVARLPADNALLDRIDIRALHERGVAGMETLSDIIAELRKPGRDPRTDDNSDAFTPGVDDFSQLHEGMKLPGIVANITAFGAFIDLGIKENGLLHVSEISRRRIASASDVLRIGQRVEVTVIGVDTARKRISLSMLH